MAGQAVMQGQRQILGRGRRPSSPSACKDRSQGLLCRQVPVLSRHVFSPCVVRRKLVGIYYRGYLENRCIQIVTNTGYRSDDRFPGDLPTTVHVHECGVSLLGRRRNDSDDPGAEMLGRESLFHFWDSNFRRHAAARTTFRPSRGRSPIPGREAERPWLRLERERLRRAHPSHRSSASVTDKNTTWGLCISGPVLSAIPGGHGGGVIRIPGACLAKLSRSTKQSIIAAPNGFSPSHLH